jgi:hypothetical protein
MNSGRGLALIEVVAATVLLSVLAAASVPLVRQSCGALVGDDGSTSLVPDLARFADECLADPDQSGLRPLIEHAGAAPLVIRWPRHSDVTVRRLELAEPSADHAWMVFGVQADEIARWIPLSKPKSEKTRA